MSSEPDVGRYRPVLYGILIVFALAVLARKTTGASHIAPVRTIAIFLICLLIFVPSFHPNRCGPPAPVNELYRHLT